MTATAILCLAPGTTLLASDQTVNESARNIPVVYDVDVVVVGGSSGAVAAAVKAAQTGAQVFLAAPRQYLGDDICGAYRLWLEPGEVPNTPLANELFVELSIPPEVIAFTYEADLPSGRDGVPSPWDHKDTDPPSLLTDGKWDSASTRSVQYGNDVNIVADLGEEYRLQKIHVMAYQENNDFEVESVTVFVSNDAEQWEQVAFVMNEELGGGPFRDSAIDINVAVTDKARYVKFFIKKGPLAQRILLGEIVIDGTESANGYPCPRTPEVIKHSLDRALLDAGVKFLFGCYATDVLRDTEGNLAGIVIANRSGRQAVKAKVIIDATPRAAVGRIAGCVFQPYPAGPQTFKRIVVTNEVQTGEGIQAQIMPSYLPEAGRYENSPIDLSAPVTAQARYVKFFVKKGSLASYILLGEILMGQTLPFNYETDIPSSYPHNDTTPPSLLRDGLWYSAANQSVRYNGDVNIIADLGEECNIPEINIMAYQRDNAFEVESVTVSVSNDLLQWQEVAHIGNEMLGTGGGYAVEYTINIPMDNGSFACFAEAEQVARDRTWSPEQVDASEFLFQVPPDQMNGKNSLSGDWPGANDIDLDVFRPADCNRLYVLGGCADMPRQAAEKLLRPLALMDVGTRVGNAAAAEANLLSELPGVEVAGISGEATIQGEVGEFLMGVRPTQMCLPTVISNERLLPVLGEYDVVVVGGGTSGAPAGIGAARGGAKTLVIEYLHGLGGVGTLGLIGRYWKGYQVGFTAEIDEGLTEMGGNHNGDWDIEKKMEWYRRQLRQAGAEIWFGVLGCGAFVENGQVKGVVVATPEGRGVVLAKVVIDSTGNSDIAVSAGASYIFTGPEDAALQGTGLPPRLLACSYLNTDWTYVDDSDVVDAWSALVTAKERYSTYDVGQLIDTRERRRIVGDFVLSPLDVYNHRTFSDTVVQSRSNFDSHSFTVHPLFMLKSPDFVNALDAYTPYRCMLPKGLNGILVTGLGVSAHRDVLPFIRMQPDIQNQGYAAGVAAAMAVETEKDVRDINVRALQEHLVAKGNLPMTVLSDGDPLPLPQEDVAQAVGSVVYNFVGLEVILRQPQDALPLLQDAYETADCEETKLTYARILGIMGDATGVATLVNAVQSQEWDTGWTFTNVGGQSLSKLDSIIIALGYTGDRQSALGPILEKLGPLDSNSEFSHHRAVALALERLADPAAAEPLAQLLAKPGMTGYAITDVEMSLVPHDDNKRREFSLRELILARALYRCGDYEGLGENILKEYELDLHGHYSRHAHAVLREKSADLNDDCEIGFEDLWVMVSEWLYSGDYLKADLRKDGKIDFEDFTILANTWLEEQPWP